MTRTTPADRFGHLFTRIDDPVVELELVEETPVVRTVNPAFESVFGYDREDILDESLNEFIVPEDRADEATRFDRRTAEQKQNTGLVTRETATGPRKFLYRGIPYERPDGEYAFAMYTDVTDQYRYERHIEVVHRLLRHDLRTELQVIMGTASQITARTDDDALAELSTRIVDRAEQLSSIGEEIKSVEQDLLDDPTPGPLDLARLCRTVVPAVRAEYPETTVSTEVPDSGWVVGIESLQAVLRALLDNAAVHGGGHVRFSMYTSDEEVVVEVADDGPGIPDTVRATVFEDREITPLEHSSGVGLWLVRWVTEVCGGRLEYDRTDGWTVVRISLPAAEEGGGTGAGCAPDTTAESTLDNP